MVEFVAVRSKKRAPTHPGQLLANTVLPATGKSKAEFARLLGISRQSLYDILSGSQPVSPATAVRLGKLCGNGPRLWLNMQSAYDLWQAQKSVDVSKIMTLEIA